MNTFHRHWTVFFGVVSIGLGLALIVVTAVQGGGSVGFVLGVLFVALGIGRLYLLHRG